MPRGLIPESFVQHSELVVWTEALVSTYKHDNCAICHEAFTGDPPDICRVLECLHVFHAKCVDLWFIKATFCPLCKSDLKGPSRHAPSQRSSGGLSLSSSHRSLGSRSQSSLRSGQILVGHSNSDPALLRILQEHPHQTGVAPRGLPASPDRAYGSLTSLTISNSDRSLPGVGRSGSSSRSELSLGLLSSSSSGALPAVQEVVSDEMAESPPSNPRAEVDIGPDTEPEQPCDTPSDGAMLALQFDRLELAPALPHLEQGQDGPVDDGDGKEDSHSLTDLMDPPTEALPTGDMAAMAIAAFALGGQGAAPDDPMEATDEPDCDADAGIGESSPPTTTQASPSVSRVSSWAIITPPGAVEGQRAPSKTNALRTEGWSATRECGNITVARGQRHRPRTFRAPCVLPPNGELSHGGSSSRSLSTPPIRQAESMVDPQGEPSSSSLHTLGPVSTPPSSAASCASTPPSFPFKAYAQKAPTMAPSPPAAVGTYISVGPGPGMGRSGCPMVAHHPSPPAGYGMPMAWPPRVVQGGSGVSTAFPQTAAQALPLYACSR